MEAGKTQTKETDYRSDDTVTEFSSTTKESLVISCEDDENKNTGKSNDVNDETKDIQLNLENENLKQEISLLKKRVQYYEKNYVSYDHFKNQLETQKLQYEYVIENFDELKVQELNQKLSAINKELQQYKDYSESYKTEYKKVQEELDEKKKDLNELRTYNNALKEEASKYQSALGAAINFRTSDDKNHSVQLKDDILSLQDSIENYVTNLKGKIEVNINNVEKLIQDYRCLTKITKENQNKPFIKAVLQFHVLDTVIGESKNYLEKSTSLESDIFYETNYLCSLLNKFSGSRKGSDTITPISSKRIRQEAYVALSNRGFSEIIENNQTIEHEFIERIKHILNNSMNRYRTINDPVKKRSVEDMATNIIRDIIRIFRFRLRAQEPIVSFSWIRPHVKIDPNIMSGRWEKDDDEIENLIVDLCYFPMIGLNLNDPSKRKLYTRAKVFPIYQERGYARVASDLFEKGCQLVKNVMPTNENPVQQVDPNGDVRKHNIDA